MEILACLIADQSALPDYSGVPFCAHLVELRRMRDGTLKWVILDFVDAKTATLASFFLQNGREPPLPELGPIVITDEEDEIFTGWISYERAPLEVLQ